MADRRVSVLVDADVSPFVRGVTTAAASAKLFARELESADSRMANLVQSGLALAPAVVPLGAAAVPALAGITSQLGFTVAAAGTAVLAFQGVGDALDALNKYKIKPTSENYAKLREEMDQLGPAGREFVFFLQEIRPQLQDLQDIAQDGLFPGMQDGIEEALQLLPEVERIIGSISTSLGGLMAEAGDNLNDARWVDFFEYLDREAAPTLTAMGRSFGNLVEGFTNMVMELDPAADMFTTGLLDASRAFVRWSDGLDSSQGFEDFVAYIRENGPQAMETLGAIANALIELVEAAAPVGAAALPVLEAIANAFSAIADSPIGPVLITTAAAVGTLGRSLALLEAVGLRGANKNVFSRIFDPAKVKEAAATIGTVTSAQDRARLSSAKLAEAEAKRAATFRAGVGQMGRWAAGAAGVAVAATGIADEVGLANTATLGLLGSLGGPAGAVIGAAAGMALDLAASNDELSASYERVKAGISDTDLGQSTAALMSQLEAADRSLAASSLEMEEAAQRGSDALWLLTNPMQALTGAKNEIEGLFGDSDIEELETQSRDAALALYELHDSLAIVTGAGRERLDVPFFGKTWTHDVEALDAALVKAKPALDALGYSMDDLKGMSDSELRQVNEEIEAWIRSSQTGAGRTRLLADAFQGLEDEMESTVTAAEALKAALDAVLGPGLNLSAATDAWRSGLRNLNEELAENSRSLTAQTDAADQNRRAIDDSVSRLRDLLVAEAEAGASSGKLARMLREQREALLDAGAAAGLSRKELRVYINELGLTPKMVRTVIALNTQSARQSLAQARRELEAMDGKTYRSIMEIHTVRTGAGGQGAGYTPSADGSTVPKDGGPYADRFLYALAPGEEIISNRWGQADRNRAELKAANAGAKLAVVGYADGGTTGGGGNRRSLDDRLEILRTLEMIRDLEKSLRAKGKDHLDGLARRIAETELEAAQRDLRAAKHREEREARAKAREEAAATLRGVRDAFGGFSLDGIVPDNTPVTIAGQTQDALAQLKQQVLDAGGEWTKAMRRWAKGLVAQASALDDINTAIEAETANRDQLVQTLQDQQQALEQLQSTMEQFNSQVASHFLVNDLPGRTTTTVGGAVDPVLASKLSAAEQRLIELRSSSTGDSVSNAAEASRLMAGIDAMRAEVAAQAEPVEQTVDAYQSLRDELTSNTTRALEFAAALEQLSTMGLNSGLFQQIASEADLETAQDILAGGQGSVDEANALWAANALAAAQVAAYATQEVYGDQQAAMLAQIEAQNQLITQATVVIDVLTQQAQALGEQVRAGAEAGSDTVAEKVNPHLVEIKQAIRDIPRAQHENKKKSKVG